MMGYRETPDYTVFETGPSQFLDVGIEIGKSVSQIAAGDQNVIYRQNGMYAGKDEKGTWIPIGDLIKDGQPVQQGYGVMQNWAYFVIPKTGRPYVGYIDHEDFPDVILAFQTSPMLRKDGKTDIRSVQEKTAPDIALGPNRRSAIGVKTDGTIVMVTTKGSMTLKQLEALMATLGCDDALNMDGGGSVTKNYKNEPFGVERKISSAVLVREKAGNLSMAKKVVLDAGHGAKDPGANGNGLIEKVINLVMAQKVKYYLEQKYEVEITMTRNDDTFIELDERAAIANRINADYFVSLHHNAGGGRGFETFVYPGQLNKETGRMQKIIHDKLATFLKGNGMPDRGRQEKDLRVLYKTNMPAVLIEYGFMDDAQDAAILKDTAAVESLAMLTADGIAEAVGLPLKQKQPDPPAPPTKDDITGHWAEADIRKVMAAGIMEGFPDGTFGPDQPLTRAQMASMIARGKI
jgi:N-acetylmuramoyl-L-alanine amidase